MNSIMGYRITKKQQIARGLNNSHKSGQNNMTLQVNAKYSLGFVNDETGEYHETTDLLIKKSRKKKKFAEYFQIYKSYFKENKVSILIIVFDLEKSSVSDFISFIKKKMQRMGCLVLGYIWLNDIGDIEHKLHGHLMISTTRLTTEQIGKLIKSEKFKIECCNNLRAFNNYLLKKELYAKFKKKSWGSSRKFHCPKFNICNQKH